jgi:hypothetical protein
MVERGAVVKQGRCWSGCCVAWKQTGYTSGGWAVSRKEEEHVQHGSLKALGSFRTDLHTGDGTANARYRRVVVVPQHVRIQQQPRSRGGYRPRARRAPRKALSAFVVVLGAADGRRATVGPIRGGAPVGGGGCGGGVAELPACFVVDADGGVVAPSLPVDADGVLV